MALHTDITVDPVFGEIPVRAMSLSTRHRLSQYLNGEQYITTSEGLSRDYRGLAELMGFSYSIIESLNRNNDPFSGLVDRYQHRSDATFAHLIQMLTQIERFDIIDDMTPFLLIDAKHYSSLKHSKQPMVSLETNQLKTIDEQIIIYDAYVCYSDKDLGFVQQLSQFLESPKIGLRLFIRDRDLCLGSWAYESFAQIIDSQCRKVLIILSPDFFECPECEFQSTFATGLAIEQRNRKLIPIIYKKCDLPPIIRMLTKIDMTRSSDTTDWSWNRLVNSIRNHSVNTSMVTKHINYHNKPTLLQLPSIPSNSSNDSQLISIQTITESSVSSQLHSLIPTAPPLISTQSSISSLQSEMSIKSDNSDCNPILSTQKDKNSKKLNHKNWIHSLRQKFKS